MWAVESGDALVWIFGETVGLRDCTGPTTNECGSTKPVGTWPPSHRLRP